MARSLWASVQGDPVFMRRVNGWLTIFWFGLIAPANVAGWVYSVSFVSNLSIIALALGSWSAWQASRVEVNQQVEMEKDLAGEIVQKVVQHTNVQATTPTTNCPRCEGADPLCSCQDS